MKVLHETPRKQDLHHGSSSLVTIGQINATHASRQDSIEFCVWLKPLPFMFVWITMNMMHILCIIFFAIESWIYWQIRLSVLTFTLETFGITEMVSSFGVISICYGAVAFVHGLMSLNMFVKSVWHRHFTFGTELKRQKRSIDRHRYQSVERMIRVTKLVFGDRGLLGVKGRYYEIIYVVREIIETVLQSIQAYRMSQLVSRVAINHFFVFNIVINCWSTPIIHHAFKYNQALVRLLCLVLDTSLDFISTVGIPLILSIPYFKQYDFDISDFSVQLWTDQVWVVNMIHELRIVFIASWADFASQIIFSVCLLIGLQDIKSLIRPLPSLEHEKRHDITELDPDIELAPSSHSTIRSPLKTDISAKAVNSRLVRILHKLMIMWGFILLALHLRVAFRYPSQFCVYEVRSWFSSNAECTILIVNCTNIDRSASKLTDLEDILNLLDEKALVHFEIHNCEFVEIPSRLQTFSELDDFQIYNSTLARWDADAAFTIRHHPKIRHFSASQVNLTQIPMGLRSPDFPSQLKAIEFYQTNLTAVPDDIGSIWPEDGYIAFDYSLLQSIPQGLLFESTRSLSLTGNNITIVPEELFTNPSGVELWLNQNPISELPDALTPSKAIEFIDLSYTNLESLPSWADQDFFQYAFVLAGGTPLCEQIIAADADNSTAWDLVVALEAYKLSSLNCQVFDTS